MKKIPSLNNKNCSKPIRTKQGLVKLWNTCSVHSALHCILVRYIDRYTYHNYIDNNNPEVLEIIKLISLKDINNEVYEKKANLIFQCKEIKDGASDCNSNLSKTVHQMFAKVPPLTINSNCSTCKRLSTTILPVIAPHLEPLSNYGIQGLQQSIFKYVELYVRRCK